jgi:methylase of polypeptide subunit release factors
MTPGGLFHHLTTWDPEPLRTRLHKGGFYLEALETLGLPAHWLRSSIRSAALLGHAPEGTPINTIIRLFTLGDEIDGQAALHALGDAIHGLLEIGFLDAGRGLVSSRYQLIPVANGWMACDFHNRQGEDVGDYVMGIGPSSILLDSLAPRGHGRALELASGIGWLSGNLAKAGMQVVATDLNPRALDLGRFSARLNGTDGIDFRQGDGFSTVTGETFDLIVSNPPYVQSPGGNMTFRESTEGDPICARLLREIPDHLAPGGIAIVLINWSHTSDEDWQDGPLSWVPAEGTRRWVFQSDCSSPADYAWTWINGDLRFKNETAAADEMSRWLEFYRQTGVQRISGGFMLIQKCEPGGEWTRTESRAPDNIDASSGPDLMRVLHNQTWLATAPDLLGCNFTVPEGVHAEARMILTPSGWTRETIRLISPARLSYDGQIDENILRLLAILNEGATPAAMVREIQTKPDFATMEDLPERIAALVRDLVHHGMLIPQP